MSQRARLRGITFDVERNMKRFYQILPCILALVLAPCGAQDGCHDELISAPSQAIHSSVGPCALLVTVGAIVGVSALILGSSGQSHLHGDLTSHFGDLSQ